MSSSDVENQLGAGRPVRARPAAPFPALDRNRAGGYTIQALIAAALFGFFFLSTLYLQTVLGYGPLKAGAAFIPGIAVMLGVAGAVSALVARTGVRSLVASGTAIASVGMLLLSKLTPHSSYLTGVMLPMVVLCAGMGLTFVPTMLSAISGVRERHSGLVSGVSTTATQIGGSIGIAVLASVAATAARSQPHGTSVHAALAHGYTDAYRISAFIIAAAVPVALAALRLRPRHQHAGLPEVAYQAA